MLTWIIVGVLVLVALGVAALAARSYMSGTSIKETVFRPRPEKRLGVVEQANVDGRRRLVLIKRDGVEHLIMTGGPVDVVIETGIGQTRTRSIAASPVDAGETQQPVFSRQPRTIGQAVNE